MSTRIRYEKRINSDLLVSVRTFMNPLTNKAYRVILDVTNKRYRVLDAKDHSVVLEAGKTKSLQVLKIQAKQALRNLGVDFKKELRDGSTENSSVTTLVSGNEINVD